MSRSWLMTASFVKCKFCDANVKKTFFKEHFHFEHFFGYLPYKCLHENCSGQFPSRKTIQLHCRLKHGQEKVKILIVGDPYLDGICEWVNKLQLTGADEDLKLLDKFKSSKTYSFCSKIAQDLDRRFWLDNTQPNCIYTTHQDEEHLTQKNLREADHSDLAISSEQIDDKNNLKEDENIANLNCLQSPDSNTASANNSLHMRIKKELIEDYKNFEQLYESIIVESTDSETPSSSPATSPMMPFSFFAPIKLEVVAEADEVMSSVEITSKAPPATKKRRRYAQKPIISDDWPCKRFKTDNGAWRLPCRLCGFDVIDVDCNRRKHALKHVPENTDIKWLFKCLACPNDDNCHKSLYFDTIVEKHIPKKHFIEHPKIGFHYINRNAELKDEIDAVYFMCFPY